MTAKETVLGTSKVDPRYRITLVRPLPELLKVNVGDLVVFVRDEKGNIILRVSNITTVGSGRGKR
jgi:bifunctional DNA-binding transcriptional regulator/antitoxin component of YhaV-PrlF toxin-antitoxin module